MILGNSDGQYLTGVEKMKEQKFWIVINIDGEHPNQSENRCDSIGEAEEKARRLVSRYPHLSFVICEAKKIVRVKNPIEVIEI